MKIFASFLVLVVSVVFLGIRPRKRGCCVPEKPITFIAPYGAGGSTDILARTVAEP